MRIKLLGLLGFMALLAGCTTVGNWYSLTHLFSGTPTYSIQQMSATDLYTVHDNDLCAAYYGTMSPVIHHEINRRGLITGSTWNKVNKNQVWVGMTLCQLLASQGKPNAVVKGTGLMELDYHNAAYQFVKGKVKSYSERTRR